MVVVLVELLKSKMSRGVVEKEIAAALSAE